VLSALEGNGVSTRVTGLEEFKLTESSLRRLGTREVRAFVHLQTDDVTRTVQRLPISRRGEYMVARAERWIDGLRRRYPGLMLQERDAKMYGSGVRRWSQLPHSLLFRGSAREILAIAGAAGVRSVHVAKVAGYRRRRPPKSPLAWYCVRALVVIRVEQATAGLQNTEDRFVLVRASDFGDAKKRLRQQWQEYATPYLNSEGQMVSWSLDKVIDVYETGETELDPCGAEVYSKLGKRRMRPAYVWRPKLARPYKTSR
jgi:hypothetical protein